MDGMQKLHEFLHARHPLTRCKPLDTDFWPILNGMLPNFWNYPHFQCGDRVYYNRPSEEGQNASRHVNGMPVLDHLSVLEHQFPQFRINPLFENLPVTLVPKPSFRTAQNEKALYKDMNILSENYGSIRDAILGTEPGSKGFVGSN